MKSGYNVNFENKTLWSNYDPGDIVKNKIKLVFDFVPKDLKTLIDVGCGNGIITNELAKHYSVVGVDMSQEALKHVTGESVHASSDNIPKKDNEFQMVFSSELLEHLPKDILFKTVSEFKRIAEKYIFITVPNNEFLDVNFIKCPKCNHVFHSYSHLNSFKEKDLKELFCDDKFVHVKTAYLGPKKQRYNKLLLKVRQQIGNRWFNPDQNTVCPECHNSEFPKIKGNIISKVCNGLNLIFSGKKPYWMFVLFKAK